MRIPHVFSRTFDQIQVADELFAKSQSHSPVSWSCHISNMEGYSFLTSHSANRVLFRLRIGRCRMDGIRYYRTTSNLLWVEHKVVSSIIWNLRRTYMCVGYIFRGYMRTAAGPNHSVAVSKLFPWCIGLERGGLLPCNIFQLSMHVSILCQLLCRRHARTTRD